MKATWEGAGRECGFATLPFLLLKRRREAARGIARLPFGIKAHRAARYNSCPYSGAAPETRGFACNGFSFKGRFEASIWFGVSAAANTPPEMVG